MERRRTVDGVLARWCAPCNSATFWLSPKELEMSRSIVCGVDDSSGARDAVRVAAWFADRLGLRLIVAHVAQLPAAVGYDGLGVSTWTAPQDAGSTLLEHLAFEEHIPEAEQRVMTGVPAERLAELADQEDAEMIVVGSRALGAFKQAFLGSVSHDVIGLAHCPVLVVPPGLANPTSY
jgi:nucleotide-binding universal stress UspA family protein